MVGTEVFEVTDTSHVKYPVDFKKFGNCIRDAALKCPVQVIKIEE